MTYAQAWEFHCGRASYPPLPTPGEERACSVLAILKGRGGFDEWFNDIPEVTKNDIFHELAESLE